jgi:hypothetical protein
VEDFGSDAERRRRLGANIAAGTVLVALAVTLAFKVGSYRQRVAGGVMAEGTSLGNIALQLDSCLSISAASPAGSLAAELHDRKSRLAVSVVRSGDDMHVWLHPSRGGWYTQATADAAAVIELRERDCPRWDVTIERAPGPIGRARPVSGHAHAACRAGGGDVKIDVEFERCAGL